MVDRHGDSPRRKCERCALTDRERTVPEWRSEGDHALDHEALELAAVADVVRREVEVALLDELDLGEHVRSHEPAATELRAAHRDVVRDVGERALHDVVASADV